MNIIYIWLLPIVLSAPSLLLVNYVASKRDRYDDLGYVSTNRVIFIVLLLSLIPFANFVVLLMVLVFNNIPFFLGAIFDRQKSSDFLNKRPFYKD